MNNIEAYMNSLDTYIDVLKKESAKLSDMITKLNDKIQEAETEKEQLIKEQNEPKFERACHGEPYYYIYGNNMEVAVASEDSDYTSEVCYIHNNYFHDKERAQEVADKIRLLLKLERLHDIYCPNYKPNWGSYSIKHYICYDALEEKWCSRYVQTIKNAIQVYFPTKEIAQKVCDILNSEEQNNEIS